VLGEAKQKENVSTVVVGG